MDRQQLEKQLETATAKLGERTSALKSGGVGEDAYCSDPVWRNLDAVRRKAKTRLVAVGKLEKREADAQARKQNPEAGEE